MKRFALYKFRKKQKLTQAEMAEKIGVSTSGYVLIELGKRNGTMEFWEKLQSVFNLPDEEIWGLMKCEKE